MTPFPSRLGGATWARLTPIKVGRKWNRNEAENYTKKCIYLITFFVLSDQKTSHNTTR